MNESPWEFYDRLLALSEKEAAQSDKRCEQLTIGQVWTLCLSSGSAGLCMTPQDYSRTLSFPGTLAGRPLAELVPMLRSWQPFEAAIGMAAVNAALPFDANRFDDVVELGNEAGNLAVFDHFLPRIRGARIVVVGRYPGLERYEVEYGLKVVERMPGPADYPDPAAEYLIPEADWLFLTASSIANKTFPRLAELGRDATTVLMGPTTPWLPQLSEWGIDFLAGVCVGDTDALAQVVGEGGGRRIFEEAVSYRIADTGQQRVQAVKARIAELAGRRDALKSSMDAWYGEKRSRFPDLTLLEGVQEELSALDTVYKQMWDARNR